MASPDAYTIAVDSTNTGFLKVEQTEDTAKTVSELLQKDLKSHHVFFNQSGFHNHISHQLLALYGVGAPASALQAQYEENTRYQRPVCRITTQAQSWDDVKPLLGKGDNYATILDYFQRRISADGWQHVLIEHLFSGSPAAEDMLVRLHAGFLHPLIQLMYGIEWAQPAVVAEALAQTAVHKAENLDSLLPAAEAASRKRYANDDKPAPGFVELHEAVATHPALKDCVSIEMGSKINEGVLATEARRDAMREIMSRVHIRPHELEERTAEMYDSNLFVGASAAVHPTKAPKFDFFLIHHINANPFYLALNSFDWVPRATKVRLLEWKVRMDLLQYAARGSPPMQVERIQGYQPRDTSSTNTREIITPLFTQSDDGHAIKLARAALVGWENARPYTDRPWLRIRTDEMRQQVLRLIVESVRPDTGEVTWVRSTGLEGAWANVPERAKLV